MKTTIDDLRSEYRDLFKKEPAKRWNKTTLNKKITDEQILQSAYASKDRSESPSREPGPKPEFEKMAAAGGAMKKLSSRKKPLLIIAAVCVKVRAVRLVKPMNDPGSNVF